MNFTEKMFVSSLESVSSENLSAREGEKSAYEKGGDARQKFWIKPLKETDLGVAQAFLTPKRHC